MLKHLRTFSPVVAGLILLSIGIFFGEVWGLYHGIPYFDKVLHFTGGIIAAWFALSLLQNDITRMAWWKQIIIIVGVASLIGVVWEWAEFVGNETQYTNPTVYRFFHGGSLTDTIMDLVSDVAGALALSLWALRKERS
jgi:hypothetical protein